MKNLISQIKKKKEGPEFNFERKITGKYCWWLNSPILGFYEILRGDWVTTTTLTSTVADRLHNPGSRQPELNLFQLILTHKWLPELTLTIFIFYFQLFMTVYFIYLSRIRSNWYFRYPIFWVFSWFKNYYDFFSIVTLHRIGVHVAGCASVVASTSQASRRPPRTEGTSDESVDENPRGEARDRLILIRNPPVTSRQRQSKRVVRHRLRFRSLTNRCHRNFLASALFAGARERRGLDRAHGFCAPKATLLPSPPGKFERR